MPPKMATNNATSSQGFAVKVINQLRSAPAQPRDNHAMAYTALKMVSTSHKRRRMRAYSLACFCRSGSRVVIGFPILDYFRAERRAGVFLARRRSTEIALSDEHLLAMTKSLHHLRGKQCQDLFRFHHFAIRLERGEKCLMNVFRRDDCVTIFQITRCAGIFGDNDLKAKIRGSTSRRVHAHMSHHAGDDDTFDLPAFQKFKQACI